MITTSAYQDAAHPPGRKSFMSNASSRQTLDAVASFMASTSSIDNPDGRTSLIGNSSLLKSSSTGRKSIMGARKSIVLPSAGPGARPSFLSNSMHTSKAVSFMDSSSSNDNASGRTSFATSECSNASSNGKANTDVDAVASFMASTSSLLDPSGRPSLVGKSTSSHTSRTSFLHGRKSQVLPTSSGRKSLMVSSSDPAEARQIASFMASTSSLDDPSGRPSLVGGSSSNTRPSFIGRKSLLSCSANQKNHDRIAAFMSSTSAQAESKGRLSIINNDSIRNGAPSAASSDGRKSLMSRKSLILPRGRNPQISSSTEENAVLKFMQSTSALADPSGRPSLIGGNASSEGGKRPSFLSAAWANRRNSGRSSLRSQDRNSDGRSSFVEEK